MSAPLKILITNDDGVHAEGLELLEQIARDISDDVTIVAPEMDQSGVSHSLSLSDPIRVREIAPRHFAVKGTPTDCVIMGVKALMPSPPNLILSGVNRGQNLADDITYSGTIAGAIEGAMLGIRSIALSQAYHYDDRANIPYATARTFGAKIIRAILDMSAPSKSFFNVNFPICQPDQVRGIRMTRQGTRNQAALRVEPRVDERNFPYYWLGFERRDPQLLDGTDLHAVLENFISITPLQLDLTDYSTLRSLEDRFGAELRIESDT